MDALLQMTLGQIKDLELAQNKIGDVIDQKKEFINYHITSNKIKENWAEKFMEEFDD